MYDRAIVVFRNYGSNLSILVYSAFILAPMYDKVDEVLAILEEHFENHLGYQDPDVRGVISDELIGVNPTMLMFRNIFDVTLSSSQ
jgi:hypothetical protein